MFITSPTYLPCNWESVPFLSPSLLPPLLSCLFSPDNHQPAVLGIYTFDFLRFILLICVFCSWNFISRWSHITEHNSSRSIQVVANGSFLFVFYNAVKNIVLCPNTMLVHFHCVYIQHIFFIYSSTHRLLNCFHVLTTVNSTPIYLEIYTSFQIHVSTFCRWMFRGGISVLYVVYLLLFEYYNTIFYSSCPSLQSNLPCTRVPFFLYPDQPLLFLRIFVDFTNEDIWSWILYFGRINFPIFIQIL